MQEDRTRVGWEGGRTGERPREVRARNGGVDEREEGVAGMSSRGRVVVVGGMGGSGVVE
jgi:hypothetical protein